MAKSSPSAPPTDAAGKAKALDLTMKQIEKQFGKGAVMKMGDAPPVLIDAVSTGSLTLDHALGIGGGTEARLLRLTQDRAVNIALTTTGALNLVRRTLLG